MIGLVIVSHSARLAEGVREVVEQVVQGGAAIATAGGTEIPDAPIGTDPAKVAAAIESLLIRPEVSDVLVLMDLGSAIMSAEAAFELLPEAMRSRVHLCEAPLVEGALAAAVRAKIGGSLAEVYAEAREALAPKIEQLASWQHLLPASAPAAETTLEQAGGEGVELTIVVPNRLGLHARPAARLVTLVAQYDAQVTITHQGRTVPATSLNQLVTLGVRQHDVLVVRAAGPEAEAAIAAIEALALDNLGDPIEVTEPTEIIAAAVSEESNIVGGVPASEGLAVGPAFHLCVPTIEVEERIVVDTTKERQRLREAVAAVVEQLRTLRAETSRRVGAAEAGIFDAQMLMIGDRELLNTAEEAIELRRLDAASAWNLALSAVVARYRALNDPYLARRAEDVLDAGQRVLRHLAGVPADTLLFDPPEPAILVATDLRPSNVAKLPADRVLGIITAEGGPTGHGAILARSLGIPAVTGIGAAAVAIADGQIVGLDGSTGHVWLAPDPQTIEQLRERRERWLAERSELRRRAQGATRLRSGETIEVAANINLPDELETALLNGAEGVGLFRTEFLYLEREAPPSEEEQLEIYQDAARRLKGRPLVIRTLDIGGDKPLPYLRQPRGANPFLGQRGLRYCLDHPGLFRPQMRAILRAAADYPIRVMFPMVSRWEELVMVDALIDEICAELQAEGLAFDEDLQRGVMIETPSAVLIADHLARLVDFFSIGTNDLAQYIMAADRDNAAVANLVNPYQPAVLRAIRETVEAGHANGIKVSLCGEMAGDLKATALLIGLGIDALSMSPAAIPVVKERIRRLELTEAKRVAAMALEMSSAEEIEAYLAEIEDVDAVKTERKP